VSEEGVKLENIGAFSVRPLKKSAGKVIIKDRAVITTRQGTHREPFLDSSYCIRIESLDTGEKRDIKIDTTFDNGVSPEIAKNGSIVTMLGDLPKDDLSIRRVFDEPITVVERGNSSDNTRSSKTKRQASKKSIKGK